MSKILMEALAFKPNGTLIPTIATLPDNPDGEVVFIIKEDKHYIRRAGIEPSIVTRNGIVETDSALGFFTMFMINGDDELIYDCWLNYHDDTQKRMIQKLCIQKRVIFEYRDSNMKKSNQFMMENCLAPLAREYSIKGLEYGHWTTEDYNILKNSMESKYPIYIDLWNELEIKEDEYAK
jgi:hypothetical protein